MVPQKHNPVKMDNEWHWTVTTDKDTYILATFPPASWFVLVTLKDKEERNYMVDSLSMLRDELDGIEEGLYDWVKRAVRIHQHAYELRTDSIQRREIKLGQRTFKVEYDQRGDSILIHIPELVVVANRSTLTNEGNLPEINYIAGGRLLTKMTDYLVDGWVVKPDRPDEELSTPFIFNKVDSFGIDGYEYHIAYNQESDLLYLKIPKRVIETHTAVMDHNGEITEIQNGRLVSLIRKFVESVAVID